MMIYYVFFFSRCTLRKMLADTDTAAAAAAADD